MGGGAVDRIPLSDRFVIVHLGIQKAGRQVMQGCFKLRQVDKLALSGFVPVFQSRDQGSGCETRTNAVGIRSYAHRQRPAVRPADVIRYTGDGRKNHPEGSEVLVGTFDPETVLAHHDDFWFDLLQRFVAKAPFIHDSGSEILHNDIGPCNKISGHTDALRIFHIQRQAHHICAEVIEISAAIDTGNIVLVGCRSSCDAWPQTCFHPDDRRSVIGEEFQRQRADHSPAERCNLQI